ncbi:MAG: apolipoprotein N-acyltransferase [Acidimicrobiales bacterium]
MRAALHRPLTGWLPVAAACLGSGLLIAAALPPVGIWPLAFVGVALLDWTLADQRPVTRFGRGTLAAAATLFPTVVWMQAFTLAGYLAAAGIMAAMFGAGYAVLPPTRGRWFALPAVIVLVEAVRGRWPFGGVPLSTLAHAEVASPLGPVVRLGGPLLLIGVTVVGGMAIAAVARRRWRPAAIGAAIVIATALAGMVAPHGRSAGGIDVALVQGGGPQGTRAAGTDERAVFERHLAASNDVPAGTDLVVWPEDIVDVDGDFTATPEGMDVVDLTQELDATLVAGVVEGEGDRFRNAAVAIAPDGSISDRYEKVRRVPFGEYVPFRRLLAPLGPDELVPRDALIGGGPAVLDTPVGRVGVVISWEVFFADRARDAVGHGGRLLLNPTNGASFSGTMVQTQQIAASRLRALETGRWVLQVAPTGFSAIITSDGRVIDRTDISERVVVTGHVALRDGQTLATHIGDWPIVVLAVVALAVGWWFERRRPELSDEPGRARPAEGRTRTAATPAPGS